MPDYGLDISIPFSGGDPDPTLPWADDDDALLVPGSVLLVEPAHSASPLSGVPVNGTAIPNIGWKRARDIVGSAVFTGRLDNGSVGSAGNVLTVTAMAAGKIVPGQIITGTNIPANTYVHAQLTGTAGGVGTYSVFSTATAATTFNVASTTVTASLLDASSAGCSFGTGLNNSVFATERTAKGGLHVPISQTLDTADGAYNFVSGKAAHSAYMLANQSHSFYMSQWDCVTRPASLTAPTPPNLVTVTAIGGATTNFIQIFGPYGGQSYPSGGNRIGRYDSSNDANVVGNRLIAQANSSVSGTLSGFVFQPFVVGHPGAWSSAANYGNKSASRILYRVYIEDLTVSGRTYADVLAQDQALYAAAFGTGGRYNGDTYTAPLA